jgi:hypothetical protein
MAVVVGLASCGGSENPNVLEPGPTPDAEAAYRTVAELAVTPNRNVDLLFVVDDSPSMADKQVNLAANIPALLNALENVPGGFPDIHIGVITTDLGAKASDGTVGPTIGSLGQGGCSGVGKSGNLQTAGASVQAPFVSDRKESDGSRSRNYTGDLASVLTQMVRVGSGGCGFEQPLAAMRAGLENNAANAGFLREDATLAVVILADEDDCSLKAGALLGPESVELGRLDSFRCTQFGVACASGGNSPDDMKQVGEKAGCRPNPSSPYVDDVAPYVEFLNSLKSTPDKLVVATIIGTPAPVEVELQPPPGGGMPNPSLKKTCTYSGPMGLETAYPGVRLTAFANAFERHATETICNQDLSPALQAVGAHITSAAGSPCVTSALPDRDPNQPGIQPDCLADDILGTSATPVPACNDALVPACWRVVEDAAACPTGAHQRLEVMRVGTPDPSTVTRLRCRL